jgi:AcrR family transcriptional regulator
MSAEEASRRIDAMHAAQREAIGLGPRRSDEKAGLGPSRQQQKSRATRDALIELATELFSEVGYAPTSIRDIGRAGEVTSGAIYGHFRSKADLLAAAISACIARELESHIGVQPNEADYIEVLTNLAELYPDRDRLRALIVEGAAAARTDEETRVQLAEEQMSYLERWLTQYEENRDRMGIDASVDIYAALFYTWAAELGLGVLEAIGVDLPVPNAWADIQQRLARSLQMPLGPSSPVARLR